MSHPDNNPTSPPPSSSHPLPPPPSPIDTIISLTGLLSRASAFRLPTSHFSTFSDLLAGAYTAFSISETDFDVHLHIYRKVLYSGEVVCEEESVFGEDEWEVLKGRGMEEVALWVHFVRKSEEDEEEERGRRRVHSAETDMGWTIKPKAPVRKTINPDSSMVYALCCPIPSERYGGRKYFSKGETVFIPVPGWVGRPILFPPRIAPPFPGFQPMAPATVANERKGNEPANSNEHTTAQDDFDYGAAVQEAFRTAERIEYASPPLFPSHEEFYGEGGEEMNLGSNPASSFPSLALDDQEHVEERGDETGDGDESDYDDIFNDDWMVDESRNDLEADSDSDSDQPAAVSDMPPPPAETLVAETPAQSQTPYEEEVRSQSNTTPTRQPSESSESDSLFIPEAQDPATRGSDDGESLFVPE